MPASCQAPLRLPSTDHLWHATIPREICCTLLGGRMLVFNPPPGWPAMPSGWEPGPEWTPSPSWPAAPAWWTFYVPAKLKMLPLDLSKAVRFGPPGQINADEVNAVARSAADSIAWRLCELAVKSGLLPTIAYLHYQQEVERALREAQTRVYSPLVADTKEWAGRFPAGSTERLAADNLLNFILNSRDGFPQMARGRIQAVLDAAGPQLAPRGTTPGPTPPKAAPPTTDRSQKGPGPAPSSYPGPTHAHASRPDLLRLLRKARNSAWINGTVSLFAVLIGVATVSAAIKYGGHYLIAWGPALWCGVRCYRSLQRYRTLMELTQPSVSPRGPAAASRPAAAGAGAPPTTEGSATASSARADRGRKDPNKGSALEPALGSIALLIGLVGLAMAAYFSMTDNSNRQVIASTPSPSILPTPLEASHGTAANATEACTRSVQASLDYSDPASEAFTYTRNVLRTKTGLSEWSISGFVDDRQRVLARVNFDCTVEKTPTGGWHTTYTVTPSSGGS